MYFGNNILKISFSADWNDPEIGNKLQKFQIPEVLWFLEKKTKPKNGPLAVMVLPFAHLGFCSLKHGHALTATKFEVDDPIIVLLEGGGGGEGG